METEDASSDPAAPLPDARAVARTKTASAVISPPKSETDWMVALPSPVAMLDALVRAAVGVIDGLFVLGRGDRASGALQLLVERLLGFRDGRLSLARVRRLRVQGLQADQAIEI